MNAHPALPAPLRDFARADPARAGVFCDFDGTLSAIVPDPDDARPVRGAATALVALARVYRVVAVLTGRAAIDLRSRLRASGVVIVGLHGLEELRGREVVVPEGAAAHREGVEQAAASLASRFRGVRGVRVEHKGLAVAVHFRRAPDPEDAQAAAASLVHEVAARHGLLVVPGRLVLELRPPAGGDKGDALRRIARDAGLDAALVAGDDVGDLPAMRAAKELSVSVCVGVVSSESPPELATLADVSVGQPSDVVLALRALARAAR